MPKHTKKSASGSTGAESGVEFASLQAANFSLDTLEVEGCKHDYLKEIRKQCRKVSNVLLAKHLENPYEGDPLFKAQRNIRRCSLQGAFRNLSESVNYKIGQALCKNRLCPNCQRILAAKRKRNFLRWYGANKDAIVGAKYGFYHLVLTMKHKAAEGVRTDVYTQELLENFKKLRGGLGYRDNHEYWNKRVDGGIYSAETTSANDKTLHIHLHCLIFGKMPLWRKIRRVEYTATETVHRAYQERVEGAEPVTKVAAVKRVHKKKKEKAESDKSEFEKEITARWLAITGDSTCGVFIEPIYKLDKNKQKVYLLKSKFEGEKEAAQFEEDLQEALSECIKYTMKSDEKSISEFTTDHLRGLLELKKRYHGRFVCLTPKSKASKKFKHLDWLNVDENDLEAIKKQEERYLFNPETGEIMDKKDTRIAVTWFANTKAQESDIEIHNRFSTSEYDYYEQDGIIVETAEKSLVRKMNEVKRGEGALGGDTYYSFNDLTQVVYFENDEKVAAARRLAGTMYARYEQQNDLYNPKDAVEEMQTYYTITPSAVQQLKGCSAPTARKEIKRVRELLKLHEREPLMLKDLAAAWNANTKDLAETLYNSHKR